MNWKAFSNQKGCILMHFYNLLKPEDFQNVCFISKQTFRTGRKYDYTDTNIL